MTSSFQKKRIINCTCNVILAVLHCMLQGVIDEEKLDMFNMPCYFPTVEEVKHLVEAEGSFTLSKLETFTVDWSGDETQNLRDRVEFVVKSIRLVPW